MPAERGLIPRRSKQAGWSSRGVCLQQQLPPRPVKSQLGAGRSRTSSRRARPAPTSHRQRPILVPNGRAPKLPRAHLPEVLRRLGRYVRKQLHLYPPRCLPADRHVCGRWRRRAVSGGGRQGSGAAASGCVNRGRDASGAYQRTPRGCWGSVAAGATAPRSPWPPLLLPLLLVSWIH